MRMCTGVMVHARIERLVYAASDPRTGAAGSGLALGPDRMRLRSRGLDVESERAEFLINDRAARRLFS